MRMRYFDLPESELHTGRRPGWRLPARRGSVPASVSRRTMVLTEPVPGSGPAGGRGAGTFPNPVLSWDLTVALVWLSVANDAKELRPASASDVWPRQMGVRSRCSSRSATQVWWEARMIARLRLAASRPRAAHEGGHRVAFGHLSMQLRNRFAPWQAGLVGLGER